MAVTKGRVADAAHDCTASFDVIAQIHTPESESSIAALGWSRNEDGRSRFQIWMSNLGAAHPATDRRSADYRLRGAPEVVDRIVELLEELSEINSEVLAIVSGGRSNRDIAGGDSDTDSLDLDKGQDELSELFLSTGDVLTSLFKVSMLVKKATTRDRYARAASAKDNPYLVEFDVRHVADKFPKARGQPWLLERLGAAITQRRQYLRYCRDHKNRIAHVPSSDQTEDVPRILYPGGNLEFPAHNTHVASSAKTPMTRPTLSPTTASTLQPDKIVQEDLQDLDDRDDAVSQSTSVAYSQADEEGSGHLKVVCLQDLSHHNEPFECPYCFSIVQARRQRSWRKHVLSDLRAYVCMFEDCDAGLFEDKAAWAQHDAEEHRRQWDCQHCRNVCGPFGSAHDLQEHMRSLHAGDELPREVLGQVVKSSSRPLVETAPDCPLCDFDAEVHHHAHKFGQAIPSGSQAVIPLLELQKHLALHQEQLALFAIPPAVERGVESGSKHGKSQVGPDEQIKMMADWHDLLSEPDDADNLEQSPEESNIESTVDSEVRSSDDAQEESPEFDTTLCKSREGEFPSTLPGDVVYISRQTGNQLTYKKAVYLGNAGNGQHIARDWNTKNDLKVSLPELVQKIDVTEDERIEAESIRSNVATENTEGPAVSPEHLRNITVPLGVMSTLIMKASKFASGDEWLSGYDRTMVRTTFSAFLLGYGTQVLDRSVRVEDIMRMFYASATSDASKDKTSSEGVRTAYVERHAALLTEVLIGVIDQVTERYFPDRDIISAQLREEQAYMVSRANQAVRKEQSLTTSGELADSTHEDRLSKAELSLQFVEILKSRLLLVVKGEETSVSLPKFGAHLMTQACSSFLSRLPSRSDKKHLVPTLREFYECATVVIRQDRATSHINSRSVSAERLLALFLSLLISIDAEMELERLHGTVPRLRSRFTVVLMEERSRYLSRASEIEERLFRVSQRSKPDFGIHFFTEESRRAHDKRYGEVAAGNEDESTDPDDPSESKYCYCLRASHGVMVACDGPNCRRKWFHLSCTDLEKPLSDYKTWFCVFCQPPVSKAAEDKLKGAAAADIADADDAEPELNEIQEAGETANERPPRGMICDNCKFVWRSALALELHDCPNCGSYSVFAESPPRPTSPEAMNATLHSDATGEEAIGQYFSERTNKFMSLYRRETLAEESKSEVPREAFPDPWSHLHTISSANSPRLDESPPAVPKDTSPDTGILGNTTGDGIAPVVSPEPTATITTIEVPAIEPQDIGASNIITRDGSAPMADHELSTELQLLRMLRHIDLAISRSRDACLDFSGNFLDRGEMEDANQRFTGLAFASLRLLRNGEDPTKYIPKLQSLSNVVSPLCSSVQITVEDVLIAIASSNTRQWINTIGMMEGVESVGLWDRLKLYEDLMEALFNVTEGLEDDGHLEEFAANVRKLLVSQESNNLQETVRAFNRQEFLGPGFGHREIPELLAERTQQSSLQDSQVKDKRTEGGLERPVKSPHREKENALPEGLANPPDGRSRASHLHTSSSANSPELDGSPPISPKDSLPDANAPDDFPRNSSTLLLLGRTLGQIDHTTNRLRKSHGEPGESFASTQDIEESEWQLRVVGEVLRQSLRYRSHYADYRARLHNDREKFSTLCSSIQNTLEDLLIAIRPEYDRQWEYTVRMMHEVELTRLKDRLTLYKNLLVKLTEAREGDRDDRYWLDRFDADVLELLGLQEGNSLQAARRSALRPTIWPSELEDPHVRDVQPKGASDGLLKLTHREEEGEEKETAVCEEPVGASHDRDREAPKEPAATSAGSANRRPAHREPEQTLRTGSEEEEKEEKLKIKHLKDQTDPDGVVVHRDQTGVPWFTFKYSRDRVTVEYTTRCDLKSVNIDNLTTNFKLSNCVYPRAHYQKDGYKGARLRYEQECNKVGWALAQLNPNLRGKRGLIQCAVDSWRGSNEDLQNRRVRRQDKIQVKETIMLSAIGHATGQDTDREPMRKRDELPLKELDDLALQRGDGEPQPAAGTLSEDSSIASSALGRASQDEPAVIPAGPANSGFPTPPVQDSWAPSPKPPSSALEKIDSLRGTLHQLEREVTAFEHTPPTKPSDSQSEGKRLSGSVLARVLLKLDAIKTGDDSEARVKKEELVGEAQDVLTRVDDAAVHYTSSVT